MLKHRLIFGTLMVVGVLALFALDAWVTAMALPEAWADGLARVLATGGHPPPGLVLLPLFAVLIVLAGRELRGMLHAAGLPAPAGLIPVFALLVGLTLYLTPADPSGATAGAIEGTLLVAAVIVTLLVHARRAEPRGAIRAGAAVLFGVVVLGLMGGFMLAIRREHAGWVLLAVILITKAGDIGAYFTGRACGRHKLIPWLSPGKTWEGLAGAVALAVAVAVGFAWLSQITDAGATLLTDPLTGETGRVVRRYSMGWAAVAGVLFALVGHAGDLMMSLFKRDAQVKDTGHTIPGFGGVLDVLDSPLLVIPVAYWLLRLAAMG